MRDYLEELLAEQEEREEKDGTAGPDWAGSVDLRMNAPGKTGERPQSAAQTAPSEREPSGAGVYPGPVAAADMERETGKHGDWRPMAAPTESRRGAPELPRPSGGGIHLVRERRRAERLYGRVRRTAEAAGYRGRGGADLAQVQPLTAPGGLGPEELDRVFQRDARRYDGGFELY